MSPEPLHEGDYTDRQVEAARRVLVDVGQVLASFRDAMGVVGGWVPDLLFPAADPRHVGSIDVDLALDAVKLGDGRAETNRRIPMTSAIVSTSIRTPSRLWPGPGGRAVRIHSLPRQSKF